MAQIGEEKLQETEQQTQVDQLRSYYLSRGRTPEWADARIRNLIGRNLLTDEWLLRDNCHMSLHDLYYNQIVRDKQRNVFQTRILILERGLYGQ